MKRLMPILLAWSYIAPAGVLAETSSRPTSHPGVWIRANQVGYLPDDTKIAILSSDEVQSGSFHAGLFSASIGEDQGAWGPFRHNYRLDFTALDKPGRYQVQCNGAASLIFTIGGDAYKEIPPLLLSFMRLQRCGDNPVSGKKCHQEDAIDTVTGRKVDLVGGWHDAADRIKHMITTTYCVAALLLAGAGEEGRYGAELVRKIHPDADTIYVQVADDRDHGPPAALWHEDKSDYGHGRGGPRSAWPATGKPEGPKYKNNSSGKASLAGRGRRRHDAGRGSEDRRVALPTGSQVSRKRHVRTSQGPALLYGKHLS